jgi:glycosyltransferase involved in cell wall biosynthesis
MRYCFLSTGSWELNGTLPRIRELGAALIRQGVEVSYVLDDIEYNRTTLQLEAGAERAYVARTSGVAQFKCRSNVIRSLAPDFVHVMTPSPKAWLTMRLLPRVRVVGDWDEWPAIRKSYGRLRHRLMRHVDHWLRRRASLCVVASRYMQRRFLADFGTRSLYLPHAPFEPSQPDAESPHDEATAVYLGSLWSVYDHDIVFQAAALLKQRGLTPAIEVIGGGPEFEQWAAFVRSNGLTNVKMPGYMSGAQLHQHLRHAHVLLFPMRESDVNSSRCPGKIFNYAQARRPIIAARAGEIGEILGDKACYVRCEAKSFADAIASAFAGTRPPDVDYDVGSWDARARSLLSALDEIAVVREQTSSPALSR